MTIDDIKARVAAIEAEQVDDEAAHSHEDALRAEFIAYVAAHGPADLAEMARAVLSTDAMDFARWCA